MHDNHPQPSLTQPILIAIVIFVIGTVAYIRVGPAIVVIIGGSAAIAYFAWILTTWRYPANPDKVLPVYLLALGAQFLHTAEEYLTDFPGEFSKAFGIQIFTRDTFAVAIMGVFAAFGLIKRSQTANYIVWFFVIGPGIVNAIAHLAFPVITRSLYFPGLVTVLLPTILSLVVIKRLIEGVGRDRHTNKA